MTHKTDSELDSLGRDTKPFEVNCKHSSIYEHEWSEWLAVADVAHVHAPFGYQSFYEFKPMMRICLKCKKLEGDLV